MNSSPFNVNEYSWILQPFVCVSVCVNWQLGVAKRDNPLSPFPIILPSFPSPFHLSCRLSPVPQLIPTLSAQCCLFELSDTIVALFQPLAAISFQITGKLASHRERLRGRFDSPHGVPVFFFFFFCMGVGDCVHLCCL